MIIQDAPWGSGHWEEDGVLYVGDRLACEREWEIFCGEQDKKSDGLVIHVSPLLRAATCCYHFVEDESETYELVIIQHQGIDALRLYRNDGGRYLPVHYGVVPFNYSELLDALRILLYTKPFVDILENPALQWLAKRDFSLDRIVMVSEFIRYDYPPVYWFIVANSRFAEESIDGVINRKFLSRCLGVTALQSAQLSAMRRIKIENYCNKVVGKALGVLAKQWSSIKPLLVHEQELDPACICLLGIILDHIPDIHRCHWFSYRCALGWILQPYDSGGTGLSLESVAGLFLMEWFSLQALDINPASLDSGHRMFYVIEQEVQNVLRNGGFYQLRDAVKSSIHVSLHSEVDEGLNLINDLIYNDEVGSAIWKDNEPFPSTQLLQRNSCFTPVATAGALRAIARKLENCAASRVGIAIYDDAEFWLYQDIQTAELCLLQLERDVDCKRYRVVEFLGYKNAQASKNAVAQLAAWLALNNVVKE